MTDRRDLQTFHPFARLNRLLDGIPPGRSGIDLPGMAADAPILLSVGEPQNQPPAFVAEELARAAAGWSRYPPPRGTLDYAETCVAWLARRYGPAAAALVDAKTMCLPLAGTREGLFFAALATTPAHGQPPPAILMPNPFYHVYAGAAAAAGAEAICVPATRESGFLPDYGALPPEVLARTTLCYLCSPANPQGAVASLAQLQDLIALARRYDFTVAFDECYAEIYTETPPPGALQAAAALGGGLDNMLVFHSLSKRSSAPGLRCGFVAGGQTPVLALEGLLRVGSAGVPLPTLAAGTRLWQEESHVQANRARYQANFAVAERLLGNRFGFRTPAGGFFLWLDVGDGEAATLALWREAGIKVVPGAYMCAGSGAGNPGAPYVRIALVYDAALTEAALTRLGEIL
ncbi:MAG TPA: aminotransferase class I/II-fold pyridoxal phosphate-dependent enzyme [Kiloniellales bacterium]|jgi:aspartate/methionine/tyrosine aminotransferase